MGTAGQWARDFLRIMGQPAPEPLLVQYVAAWAACEGTAARYNPLATTYDLPPNSNFNLVGVKNFESREQGLEASKRTLDGNFPGYANIRAAITSNDSEDFRRSLFLSPWGTSVICLQREMELPAVVNVRLKAEEAQDAPDRIPPRATPQPDNGSFLDSVWDGSLGGAFGGVGPSMGWLDEETILRVVYASVGAGLFAIAGSLFFRRFIPTEQIVKTVVDAAVPG